MTLVELRYLIAVAEELSFRGAAERVHVSQPALSLAIARLEDELGVKLFERSKTEVALTPVGRAVVEQARRALREVEIVRQVAAQHRDPMVGPLRLGMIHTVGPYLAPLLIPECHARWPALALAITEDLTARLRERLVEGDLDAALIALPFDGPHLRVEPLYDEPFDVVVPRGHALAAADQIAPERLRAETVLLLHSGHCFSNQVVGACPGVEERATLLEGNSLETVRNLVAAGQGVSVLPRSVAYCPATAAQLDIRPFAPPAPRRRIALAWRETFPRPQALAAIADLIRTSRLCGIEPLAAD